MIVLRLFISLCKLVIVGFDIILLPLSLAYLSLPALVYLLVPGALVLNVG